MTSLFIRLQLTSLLLSKYSIPCNDMHSILKQLHHLQVELKRY